MITTRTKRLILAALLPVLLLGLGYILWLHPGDERAELRRLARRLVKMETIVGKTHRAVWARLPQSVKQQFPYFAPKPTVLTGLEVTARIAELKVTEEKAVRALIVALQDPDAELRGRATLLLTGLGPRASAAVPELLKQCEALAPPATGDQIFALAYIAPASDEVIATLSKVLEKNKHSDAGPLSQREWLVWIHREVASAAAGIGMRNPRALELLAKLLEDPEPRCQAWAAKAFKNLGSRWKDSVPPRMPLAPPTISIQSLDSGRETRSPQWRATKEI